MKIKYNRFSLIPNTCSICGKGFWLEPYKKDIQEGFSPLGGYHIFETDICKECCDKESEVQNDNER